MENASKALMIAGGVLISVLIISVALMVYNNMSSLSNSKQQVLEAEQLSKYNMQWESYNRDNLRGADVISIYNKAIDVNQKYREQEGLDYDMITVYIKLKADIVENTEYWQWDIGLRQYKKVKETERMVLEEGKSYNTKDNANDLSDFIISTDESSQNGYTINTKPVTLPTGVEKSVDGHDTYTRSYNKKDAFKLLKFKCANTIDETKEGIEYDKYGRITKIHLVEI